MCSKLPKRESSVKQYFSIGMNDLNHELYVTSHPNPDAQNNDMSRHPMDVQYPNTDRLSMYAWNNTDVDKKLQENQKSEINHVQLPLLETQP